ncbi:MAG: response regulator transcription factor [Bacteroidales bacterium]|jgi:two-component system alkaline phosphatase synthesis response regulator PhoP|nr:response regulator transcription factor [Bacteroidales bacterium]
MVEQTGNIRILLVDDEVDILDFISYNLEKEGFDVYTATDGKMAIEQAMKVKPHLILLDVMMSGMSGIEVCEQLRLLPDFSDVIISFLSARSEDYSQISGFDAGADDYIAKPVQPKMLISKVKSLLRRLQSPADNSGEIQRKDVFISKESYTVQCLGETVVLPRKEFELLYLLASKPNKVFRRSEIYDIIWGDNVIVGNRTIDVHIRRLRERTGIGNIKTVKGVGYKYEE